VWYTVAKVRPTISIIYFLCIVLTYFRADRDRGRFAFRPLPPFSLTERRLFPSSLLAEVSLPFAASEQFVASLAEVVFQQARAFLTFLPSPFLSIAPTPLSFEQNHSGRTSNALLS
jgi:hypothetical protein